MNSIYLITYCLFLNFFINNTLLASIHTITQKTLSIPHIKLTNTSIQPITDEIDPLAVNTNVKKNTILAYRPDLQTLHQEIDRQSPRLTIAMKQKRDCNKRLSCLCIILCCPCMACHS